MENAGGAVFAIVLAMSPALAILFYVARRTRLVLTNECIKYHNVGVSAVVSWVEVERLLIGPGICGLVLKKSLDQPGMKRMQRFSGMSIYGSAYYSEMQQTLLRERRFIDLRAYRRQLLKGILQAKFVAHFPELRIDIET